MADRVMFSFRMGRGGIAAVERRARAAGVDRSEMARRMMAYAHRAMPWEGAPAAPADEAATVSTPITDTTPSP